MKEQIYTIPVTEAFRIECECPMCLLEKRFEDETVDYVLGPFLMEPDGRIQTNEERFCRRHFGLLYNKQVNRLGLGLILDTHLCVQNAKYKRMYESKANALKNDGEISAIKRVSNRISSKQTDTQKLVDELLLELSNLESKCTICTKLDYTMERYTDIILYLWFKEEEFKKLFNSKKGFCLRHLKQLLEGTKKYLNAKDTAVFVDNLLSLQLTNMERLQQEVNWFTKKFDYRNNDAAWGTSKDAIQRGIQKLAGYCDLK